MSSSNFITSGSAPNLRQYLPYPQTPWRFSSSLEERLESTLTEAGLSYKRCPILPMDKEWDIAMAAYEKQRPLRYQPKRIWCVQKKDQTKTFEHHLLNIEAQGERFPPDWRAKPSEERENIIKRWKHITDFYSPLQIGDEKVAQHARVLPLWHGSSEEKCRSICDAGYIIPGKHHVSQGVQAGSITDIGFFGSGIYFTPSARYAVDIYSRGHLLFVWVAMREPFPVRQEDMHMLKGKGSYDKHDAHYIPVVPENESDPFCPNYYPCPPDGTPVCDELVVFQNIQTKTHFWFELQADLLYVPKASPQTVSELLDLIFQVLQEPSIKNDPQIKQALKSRAGAYLMCRGEMVLTEKDRPFLETLSALFEVKRQVNDLARQNLISIGSTPIVENPLPGRATAYPRDIIRRRFQPGLEHPPSLQLNTICISSGCFIYYASLCHRPEHLALSCIQREKQSL